MAKFRKKPVVIEAVQYQAGVKIEGVCYKPCHSPSANSGTPHIHTLEGRMNVSYEDWVITGVNGERYLCKPDIFEKTYDPVTE